MHNLKNKRLSQLSNGDIFIVIISMLLSGYAIFGRGFAYLGFKPIYIGEIVLIASIILFLKTPSAWRIFSNNQIKYLLLFMIWGLLRTLPYIQTYGFSSLRDASIWGYAIFGIIMAGFLLSNPSRLSLLINNYRKFIPLFAVTMIILFALSLVITFPKIPGSEISLIQFRGGTMMVHISGAVLFMVVTSYRIHWGIIIVLITNAIIWGSMNRGGLLTFLATIALIFILRPFSTRSLKLIFGICLFSFILILSGLEFSSKTKRIISPRQIATNIYSIVKSGDNNPMQGTKNWRLGWWASVIDYTVFGQHFWDGKGYGINLAEDDGFQVLSDGSLRSPHSGHITFLARSGVPGFCMWVLLLLSWLWTVFRSYKISNEQSQFYWSNLFLFLIGYFLAFIINASFDVFLEGPMGGIWFWTVFGIGIAAVEIYKKYPDLLSER